MRHRDSRQYGFIVVVLFLFGASHLAASEQTVAPADSGAALAPVTPPSFVPSLYQDVPQFGGPSSTGAELKEAAQEKEAVFRFDGLQRSLRSYFTMKEWLDGELGLAFGLNYTGLYQVATDSAGEDQAAGGIFEFLSTWTLLGRESGNTGSLVFKLENRHTIGANIVPQNFGFEVGYNGVVGTKFSDFDWGVTNLYWQQRFFQGRFTLVAGKVDPTDYLDLYGLINPLTAFSNLAFLTNPTIAAPNQGFGVAMGIMLTEHLYTVAGFSDANGDANSAHFASFFNDNEYFKHIELGWTSSQERIYLDNIHVTGWHVDERAKAHVPDGWGIAASAAWFIQERWMPFVRGGYSDGDIALFEGTLSVGMGYLLKTHDLIGLGANWGAPPDRRLNDQYAIELFYRLQLSQNFALTPDVQLLINPVLNPNENIIAVFGLRLRLTL